MLIIITEDSHSGYQFWKGVHTILLNNNKNCEVIVAGESVFGSDNAGGVSKIQPELIYHIDKLKIINGTHTILLAVDNVLGFDGFDSKTVRQVHIIRYFCEQQKILLKQEGIININIEIAEYSCLEEIFLSFKDLLKYSCVESGNTEDIERAKIFHNIIYENLTQVNEYENYLIRLNNDLPFQHTFQIKKTSNLRWLYNHHGKNHRLLDKNKENYYDYSLKNDDIINREKMAELVLGYITLVTPDDNFFISKGIFGKYWTKNCAKINKNYINANFCKNCFLNKDNLTNVFIKWSNIFQYSILLQNKNVSLGKLKEYCGIFDNENSLNKPNPSTTAKMNKF
jgi:hypothetical protein